MSTHKPKIALVLTGGGARAAYQVGVLAAIAEWYPRVHTSPFTIYSGTSAGAINAVSLASYASSFDLASKSCHGCGIGSIHRVFLPVSLLVC